MSLLALSLVVSAEEVLAHSPVFGIRDGIMTTYNKRPVNRVLRQTDRESASQCSRVLYRTQCTSSDYAQNLIDTISKCGTYGRAVATAVELLCRKNSNGDYCGSAGIDISSVLQVQNVCSLSCSSSCRSALIALKNQQGCCLGHYKWVSCFWSVISPKVVRERGKSETWKHFYYLFLVNLLATRPTMHTAVH